MSKELTSEEVQNLISESEHLRKLKTFKVGNIELDDQSGYVSLGSIIIWALMCFIFFKINIITEYQAIFLFLVYFVILAFNLYNSATDVPDSSSERDKQSYQQNFIQGGSAVYILLLVFLRARVSG